MRALFNTIFFCSFFCFPFDGLSQNLGKSNGDYIPWSSDYRLQWDDFTAKPKKSHFASALSDISFAVDIKTENNDLVIFVQTSFNRNGSWVKDIGKNDYLLKHEQNHFDLHEVNARKLRKELQTKKLTSSNVQSVIDNLLSKYSKINEESQARYDSETEHSLKEKNQLIWNEKIEKELSELSDYSAPTFRVSVNMR